MSDLWRIIVNEESAPVTVVSIPLSTGAMLIRSPKGKDEPTKITKGQTAEILRQFGYPSTSFPDIQEAIDFNKDSDLWITAPSDALGGLHGGVLITLTGSIPLTVGVADPSLFNFSQVDYKYLIGTGDNLETNFTDTIAKTYVNLSLSKIVVGTTEIATSVTDAEPEVISGTGISAGTLTRATGAIDVTFDTAPALGEEIYAYYKADLSTEAYYVLFSKSFNSLNDESVLTIYNTVLNQWEWDFYIKNQKGVSKLINSYVGSNQPDTFNAQGENIFIEILLEDNPYFIPKANSDLVYSSFTDDTGLVDFAEGTRSIAFTSAEYTAGWLYFQDKLQYPAKIFMDLTADSSIPPIFNTLRTSYQRYSRYLLPLPLAENASTAITTKSGYSIDNRGLSFYWNQGFRKEAYTSTKFWTSLIGAVGVKHAEIIRNAFGGIAPSWLNENGLGGQLPISVEKMKWPINESDLQTLDESGINPIANYVEYGLVITSQKTAQNPNVLTDFSYIAHSGLADYHIENIVNKILIQQQVKLNDNYHRSKVKAGADAIVGVTQTVGQLTLLQDFINICDERNNDADVRNARKFVLTTAVKFTPTSEFIIFNYVSTPQGVDVEEVVGI